MVYGSYDLAWVCPDQREIVVGRPTLTMILQLFRVLYAQTGLLYVIFMIVPGRKQAVTREGDRRYAVTFPKYKKGGHVVRSVMEDSSYGILP